MHIINLIFLLGCTTIIYGKSPELYGDIRGDLNHTIVAQVGGQTASNVAQAVKLANNGTSADVPNSLVARDGSGNFAVNMITLDGTPVNGTDATNKSYVDSVVIGGSTADNIGSGGGEVFKDKTGAVINLRTIGVGSYLEVNTDITTPDTITIKTNATSNLSPNTIVARDGSGTFQANLFGDVIGDISSTEVVTVGGATASEISDTVLRVASATSSGAPSSLLALDSFGNFTANILTGDLSGNATTATTATTAITATNFSGSLTGDVTGNQGSTVVSLVGGQSASSVASATVAANSATSTNTPNTIVKRDGSGSFSAGVVTANLTGDVTGSASLNVLKSGDTMSGPLAMPAGTSANPAINYGSDGITTGTGIYFPAPHNLGIATNGVGRFGINETGTVNISAFNGSSGIVHNDSSGNLSSSLIVNADISSSAGIQDTKLATIATAGKVSNSATTAASGNTANAIVARDASGSFIAGTITATLSGNATTATTATNFSGSLTGDVTGNQGSTVVSLVGGQSATNVANGTVAANNATTLSTPNTIVKRDGSGSFSAGVITANLTGDVTGSASLNVLKSGDTMSGPLAMLAGTSANPAVNYAADGITTGTGIYFPASHNLGIATNGTSRFNINSTGTVNISAFNGSSGIVHNDSSGNLSSSLIVNADISSSAGIQDTKLATIATAGKVSNSATTAASGNTANAIVARDASGSFIAGTITATLSGNATTATTATTATNFSGSLTGDVTGNQGSTVVSLVGGQSATNVANGTVAANNATTLSTPNTIVKRDGSGSFTAGTVTANLTGNVLGNVTGSASLNVLKSGDTMTGSLTMPIGSASAPSIKFTGSTTSGIYLPSANTVAIATSGSGRFSVDGTGTVNISAFSADGVVHNDASGNLSTSLIVNSDITNGTIQDTKLATISTSGKVSNSATTATSTNAANTIVARDGSGGFNAGTIFAGTLSLSQLFANQSVQVETFNSGTTSISVNSNVSILLLLPTEVIPTLTIVFPTILSSGQFLTIILGSSFAISSITNTATPSSVINGVTSLTSAAPCVSYYNYNFLDWYRSA